MFRYDLQFHLRKYLSLNMSSFHVPGHKGLLKFGFLNRLFLLDKNKNLSKFDLTELKFTDDLYNPSENVIKIEEEISNLYGSAVSVVSTNGSTLCIQTMLKLFLNPNDKILLPRNVHKSVVNALILLRVFPIWINNNSHEQVTPKQVKEIFFKNKDVKALLITSPDYFGNIVDLKIIRNIIGNTLLLVDNAHGSHLKFLPNDLHPLSSGADACTDSAHKTLPVLTGGSWLHVAKRALKYFKFEFNLEKLRLFIKSEMSLFGSTSPSFLTLISIQEFLNLSKFKVRIKFKDLIINVNKIKSIACKVGILDNDCTDPTRLVFDFSGFNCNDEGIYKYFYKNKIEPEFIFNKKVVLIPSIFNKELDYNKLRNAINYKKIRLEFRFKSFYKNFYNFNDVVFKVNVQDAFFSPAKIIDVLNSFGKVSAQVIYKCPPGVPVILPGQFIGMKERNYLIRNNFSCIKVMK